jgi:exopolyphosphatase/guanosine-5'-triphosphate,3'-diphosphate pyrophosphatase
MPRVAAVDCGTNSIRLLVADVERDPATGRVRQRDVERRMEIVRLGAGVDATGVIDPAALDRTLAAVARYASLVERAGAQAVRFVATSATRDARNADGFVAGVRSRLGVAPEIVSGAEEAALSFAGATGALPPGLSPPYGVVDIGGGSTEVVVGTHELEAALSVDVGCVRLTERHLVADPPTAEQVAAARSDVDRALDAVVATVPVHRVRTLVGVAGTVTTIAAAVLDLDRYDPVAIHGSMARVEEVLAACARLLGMSRIERAARPYMHPGRVDVIGAGALIWSAVVERVAAEAGITHVVASEHDILDGIAASLVPAPAAAG